MAEVPFSYPFQVLTAGGRLEGQYGPGMGYLLGYDYRVRGEAERRRVVIERTYFWAFKTRRVIPFREVRAVMYGYTGPIGSLVTDALVAAYRGERFLIALRPRRGRDVTLFCYEGWARGETEAPSRAFAERLSEMAEAPLVLLEPPFFPDARR